MRGEIGVRLVLGVWRVMMEWDRLWCMFQARVYMPLTCLCAELILPVGGGGSIYTCVDWDMGLLVLLKVFMILVSS